MNFGVVVFPGSNCDHDAYYALKHVLGYNTRFVWHKETSLEGIDALILPGGFSYGDYLRSGAIARFSPIMEAVVTFADSGGIVLGVCNGFQVLCESGLLPGGLLRNASLRFVCRPVNLRVERNDTLFTSSCEVGQILSIPVAHGEGNYYADPDALEMIEASNQVVFRYAELDGTLSGAANPNGSRNNIAGLINKSGNVMGMMPHPERHVERTLGNSDGKYILRSIAETMVSA